MKALRLKATFPKSDRRDRVARFAWSDGLIASTPIYGRPSRLPHDLEHYSIEALLRPRYGFWTLAAQQAPWDSLTVERGHWPKGRREWFERVRRKHGAEMLKAEALAVPGLGDPAIDIDTAWPAIKQAIERPYSLNAETTITVTRAQVVELHAETMKLHQLWAEVPDGGGLVVHWPPGVPPIVQACFEF